MIIIQLILITGFFALVAFFLSNPRSLKIQAWKKVIGILFLITAIVFIANPDSSNYVANKVGVGRGADLQLYLLTLAFIFVSLSNYIRSKQDHNRVVILARKIAIAEALTRKNKSKNESS